MATPDSTSQEPITVEEFRKAVNEHFAKEISENTIFNANDIKRFNEIDDYASMFIKHAKHGKAFDLKRAFRIFHDAMIWRKQSNIYDVSLTEFPAVYLEKRAIYFKNQDVHNNRLLHFLVRKFTKGEYDNEMVKRYMAQFFEDQIRNHPNQQIVILFDMTNAGLSQLDYDLVKFIINALLHYYPGLVAYLLVYRLPFILYAAWRLIKSWLPVETQDAVVFVDENSIKGHVAVDQLPTSMGGTANYDE